MFRATSQNGADVTRLLERLRQASIGETVPFRDLDDAIGRPIQARRYLLVKAMDILNAETGAVFESVFGHGYRRMEIDQVHTVGNRARKRIRRIAGRGSRRMANAIRLTNDITGQDMLVVNRELAVLGMLQYLSRDRTTTKATVDADEVAPAPLAKVAHRLIESLL